MNPKAVIFDMDGTLASDAWRLSLIEDEGWESYMEAQSFDAPVPEVVEQLDRMYNLGYRILIVTNRWEKHRVLAEDWLEANLIRYHELFMRPTEDHRPGVQMKAAQYENHIEGRYRVMVAYEDKPEVAEMWREHFIPVRIVKDPCLSPLNPTKLV